MKRLNNRVERSGAKMPDWLCLSDHTSKWNMDIYLAVDKEIPNADNIKRSGKMLSKVYEGPFKDTGKWMKDFESHTHKKGMAIKKQYMWHTTCPNCAKNMGRIMLLSWGRLSES